MSRCLPRSTAPQCPGAPLPDREPACVLRRWAIRSTWRLRKSLPVPAAPPYRASTSTPTSLLPHGTAWAWKTSSQTTTKWGQTGWRSTMIVLAVHPWHGEDVTVLQRFGDRALLVERENGDRRIIPVSWTSLVPLVSTRLSDG